MRAKDIIDSLCEVDQSRRGFLKRLGTIAGGLAVSPAMVASATSPKLLAVAPPEMWNYGSPTGLPHSYDYSEVFDLATQTTPLEGNVAKFFADKGYGFTASGQLVLTPEKAKRVSHLADILGGHNVDQNTWNAINSTPRETRHEHPLLKQIYAEQSKARRELQGFDDSILSSYKQAFGKKMDYTQDTIDRSEAWVKRIEDYRKKWQEDRRRADAEKKKEQDSLKYSRMDYAGGSEDVQGVDYTTQESVMATTSRIMGESKDDPLQGFLDMLRIMLDFDLYGSEFSDYKRMAQAVAQGAANIDGLLGSEVWLEIQRYLDFMASAVRQPNPQSGGLYIYMRNGLTKYGLSTARDTFLEDNHQEKHYDLAYEVLRSIKSGQFNPSGGLMQSVLSGDAFQERYDFSSVTPSNVGYLNQIVDLFQGPWTTPEDVVDDMNGGDL